MSALPAFAENVFGVHARFFLTLFECDGRRRILARGLVHVSAISCACAVTMVYGNSTSALRLWLEDLQTIALLYL